MPEDKEDWDMNDIIIHDLAKHIEDGGLLDNHYLYSPNSDLFEYEEKIEVETSKIGLDILAKINNNNGK